MASAADISFEFKGLDHVAVVTRDMKATVDFYHGVLGMPVLRTAEFHDDAGEVIGQHWFFGVGDPCNPDAHIAAFWWKDGFQTLPEDANAITAKPKNPHAAPIGSLMHFNLRVDADKIESYCAKLSALGIPFRHAVRYSDSHPGSPGGAFSCTGMRGINSMNKYVEPQQGALMSSVYVSDPSGIQVEFNAWLPEWEKWPNDAVALANDDG
jgi:catechol 2,3-dioxygenase-like lactoylglutathione lyase family enzyme